MKWEVKCVEGDDFPWKIYLCGTKDTVCYGAARTELAAQVYSKRLNDSQNQESKDEGG